ncbi:MAG: 7-cyano-7-deazaguanine synthase QueC [Candidatus Omnitrophota bacterium]
MKKAIVLLSGGLDSATTLYLARKQGYKCYCLIFDYGQRHRKEIASAKKIAQAAKCSYQVLKIKLPWKGSALLDKKTGIPKHSNILTSQHSNRIPSTYVPARNIIFLSFALSFAESAGAEKIFIGAHSQDYSGYPDCRPEFYRAFKKVILTGTKQGVEKKGVKISTPLVYKTKAEIIRMGKRLGVPFGLTWSCYQGQRLPCAKCDSCYYRAKGFREAGIKEGRFLR